MMQNAAEAACDAICFTSTVSAEFANQPGCANSELCLWAGIGWVSLVFFIQTSYVGIINKLFFRKLIVAITVSS